MDTVTHLDWLAVTFPADCDLDAIVPTIPLQDMQYTGKGKHGYMVRYEHFTGVSVNMKGTDEQGVHVVYTAQALQALRNKGVKDKALLGHAAFYDGKPSRIDVALDVYDSPLTVGKMIRAHNVGDLSCRAKKATHIEDLLGSGETLYLGSRTSDRMIRAYNKGAETGEHDNWLRLEMEVKKLRAKALHEALIKPDTDFDGAIRYMFRDTIRWSNKVWQEIVTSQNSIDYAPEPKAHKTYTWLMDTVAPAIAKYHFLHPDDNVWQVLSDVVTLEYARLIETHIGGQSEPNTD